MPRSEPSLVERVEALRIERGLTQAEVARACGLTQGHYSKLRRQTHQPGGRIGIALAGWLEARSRSGPDLTHGWRIASLAASIREDCAELIRLARCGGEGPGAGGPS